MMYPLSAVILEASPQNGPKKISRYVRIRTVVSGCSGLLCAGFLLGTFFSKCAVAEVPSATFQMTLSGDLPQLAKRFGDSVQTMSVSASKPTISGNFLSYGPSVITFQKEHRRDWRATITTEEGQVEDPSDLLLLAGELRPDGDPKSTVPVAGSIYEENGVATLHLAIRDQSGTSTPNVYAISAPLTANSRVSSASLLATPLSALSGVLSDNDGLAVPAGEPKVHSPMSGTVGIQAIRNLEISSDADYEWFQAYGVNSNNRIATLINAMNVAYNRDIELQGVIKQQNVWAVAGDPYNSTDAGTQLTEFRTYGNANQHIGTADVYHLFSGKDFDGGTVGIAYVGVVCAYPTYSYGVTQRYNDSIDWVILAHEMGHNLNAAHDDATPNTIMNAYLSFSATAFSSTSRTQINSWTSSNGSCLTAAASPTPTPTATPTATPIPTATATPTATPAPTATATPTPTATATPVPTATATPAPSGAPTATPTAAPTATATPDPRQDLPTLDLRVSYNNRTGTLTSDVRMTANGLNQCSLSLNMGEDSSMGRARSQLLDRPVRYRRYVVTVARLPLRIRDRDPRGGDVYLQAIYDCGSGVSAESAIKRITVPVSRDSRYPTRSNWTRSYMRAFAKR